MTAPLDAIATVETFIAHVPRDVPYLGPLREGEFVNDARLPDPERQPHDLPRPRHERDRAVTGESGEVGWGETYGIAAPEADGGHRPRACSPR